MMELATPLDIAREEGRLEGYNSGMQQGSIGKDAAYAERNKLVAFLSHLFPASIEQHAGADWEHDWRNLIIIDTPAGQLSWHIHDSELPLFDHLQQDQGRKWDGHSTALKYIRLGALGYQFANRCELNEKLVAAMRDAKEAESNTPVDPEAA